MADWTDIDDPRLAPGQFVPTELMLALRDNVIAALQGATGAPRVGTSAIATGAVTNDKVFNNTLGAEKLQTGSTEVGWVMGRIAASVADSIGATVTAYYNGLVNVPFGGFVAGSLLTPCSNVGEFPPLQPNLTGTWMVQGYARGDGAPSFDERIGTYKRFS